jgi:hypothetical protein
MKTTCKIMAAAALALGAASARAGTTSVNFESSADRSIKKLGSYTGTATYDDATGLLTITVNNTSASGARVTGLAFNVDGDGAFAGYSDGDVAGTRADEDAFDDARRRKGNRLVKAKPLGMFEAGAALNGNLNAAGRKLAERSGIAAGDSHTFTFNVSGGAGLTAADFLGGDLGLVAAFRGKQPDKVGSVILPASVTGPSTPGDSTGGDTRGDTGSITDPGDTLPPIVIPPINTGGDPGPGPGTGGGTDNGTPPAAVPLPPAAIPALATFALLAVPKLKRKLREMF